MTLILGSQLEKALSVPVFSVLEDFRSVEKRPSFYNQNVSEKVYHATVRSNAGL